MKYAVIKISGSQYKISEGDVIVVDKLDKKENEKIEISEVLLLVDEKQTKIGKPFVKDTKVLAQILEEFKGEKIRVSTYKAKSKYRRTIGHRSKLAKLKILKIS